MAHKNGGQTTRKLSPHFRAVVGSLGPQDKIRAIVILRASALATPRGDRRSVVEAFRKSVGPALRDLDRILRRFGGQRLASAPDALGSVTIESTAAGITSVAASEYVKAVLEDQPISLVAKSR